MKRVVRDLVDGALARALTGSGMAQQLSHVSNLGTQVHEQVAELQRSHLVSVDRGTQILLRLKYRELAARGQHLPFDEVEFRNYSQNGEDGILWYVFALIGDACKSFVEICAANGIQCNSANLIIHHGWTGLLVDGNPELIEMGRNYYAHHPDTFIYPPRFAHAWVTAENVNELLRTNGVVGEIDLLSLDIDGMDYWVWKAIDAIAPRVVIAEVQAIWLADASVSVPYQPEFQTQFVDGFGVYCGASLPAFVNLARSKGYRLVGCQRYGFNAVFVRNDIGLDVLPEVRAEDCFKHPFCQWAHDELLPRVLDKEWVSV